MDNLDEMVETMGVMEDIDQFNKKELLMLAKKFELEFNILTPKRELFDMINQAVVARDEMKKKKMAEKVFHKNFADLVIDQLQNRARSSDGYIHATRMCAMGGKQFEDWVQLEDTREFMNVLGSDARISVSDLIDETRGNSPEYEKEVWIHPDLAVHLARWISPTFDIRVSRWAREILLTGNITLST